MMLRAVACAIAGLAVVAVPAGAAAQYAPLDRPGPALGVPVAALAAAVRCSPGVDGAARTPVLLIHGTGADSDVNWSWNHVPMLNVLGIPWCTVDLPLGGTGDLQLNAEYVVHAIREAHRRSGRRISIIGHSQGGMSPRWVFRFWPDTRAMVDDLIGYAPPNHGSTGANLLCPPGAACTPANLQYRTDSSFNAALNSLTETFAPISYTNVYSHRDFIATPNSDDNGTSSLHTGDGRIANVAIQDVCPLQTTEHLGLAYDAVAWALAYDALQHDGPAREASVSQSVCAQLVMPGVNPVTFPTDLARALVLYEASPSAPDVAAEPPLRCYVLAAGCPAGAAAVGLRIVSKRLLLRDGKIGVRLRCVGAPGARCTARVRVRHARRTLASRRVSIAAGKTASMRLPIARAARRSQVRTGARVTVEVRKGGKVVLHRRLALRVAAT